MQEMANCRLQLAKSNQERLNRVINSSHNQLVHTGNYL